MKKKPVFLKTYRLENYNVLRLNSERPEIWLDPPYQRNGDIWSEEKRQLLIDSILNEFDIPKMYFHTRLEGVPKARNREFAVIDGRQRLETVWKFIDGEFRLADDFESYKDSSYRAGGMSYAELAGKYPKLKTIFDSAVLPIVCVETNDLEVIDEMFLRLNAGEQLKAAEKRNAIGGPMTRAINKIAGHRFFVERAKFSNKRYQFREVAARLLFILFSLDENRRIVDTKKSFLDEFVRKMKKRPATASLKYQKDVSGVLDAMVDTFGDEDSLLRAQAIVPIYFLLFRFAIDTRQKSKVRRDHLVKFAAAVAENRRLAENDQLSEADQSLLEFDRLTIQGTNDAGSITQRFEILRDYLKLETKGKGDLLSES